MEKFAEKSFELHKTIQRLCGADKVKDMILAHYLYQLKKNDAWQVASGIENWEDYIRQPEINISRHKSEKLIRIYKYFVIENGFRYEDLYKVSSTALDKIAKLKISDVDKIKGLLADAEHLTSRDFKDRVFEETSDGIKTYSYMIMKKCNETGNLERVKDITSEEIIGAFNL